MSLKLFPHGCPSESLKVSRVCFLTRGINTFIPPSGRPASFTEISAHSGIQSTSNKLRLDCKFRADNSTIQSRNTPIQPFDRARILDGFSHLEAMNNCAHLATKVDAKACYHCWFPELASTGLGFFFLK